MNISDNTKGILVVSFGILLLSPDSLLIRLIDTDLWTLMFLRGLFMGISLLLLNFLINKKNSLQQFLRLDIFAWSIIVLLAISSFLFVAAIQTTSVAHTLIIVGAAPVFAAMLGLMFLQEKVASSTWGTIFIVVIALAFVVYDDQQSTLIGDMYALAACVLWSANFVLARKTRITNMVLAMSLSGFLMALISFPLATFNAINPDQALLGLFLGVLVGLAFSLITLAPHFIPAAEVAVFMPLESVFGIFLVWLFMDEYPGLISLTAGLIIILAIMLNSYVQIKKSSN